ncbi:hypothetical protein G6O67_000930 [Ophiocordyceps sinensis]|uniref:Uncharacterized protein n=1 Tax=Ophiocordyceps sinensis TaxID=72228 RepID=A0A8H4Q060_9HYPO|nr:hypothetical protein G6O67_000930 [Ophiocordyceps sinensis]
MCSTLELLDRGPITYESAANKEANILNQLPHVAATKALYRSLWNQRDVIAALAKHHLRLGHRDECVALPPCEWIRGRFNVCIPVKLAEAQYPGTVDEKLSCEVATYAWMQENCSDIRIPLRLLRRPPLYARGTAAFLRSSRSQVPTSSLQAP